MGPLAVNMKCLSLYVHYRNFFYSGGFNVASCVNMFGIHCEAVSIALLEVMKAGKSLRT